MAKKKKKSTTVKAIKGRDYRTSKNRDGLRSAKLSGYRFVGNSKRRPTAKEIEHHHKLQSEGKDSKIYFENRLERSDKRVGKGVRRGERFDKGGQVAPLFYADTETWFDDLVDLSESMKGHEGMDALLAITDKDATRVNVKKFKAILSSCECPKPELRAAILAHLDKVIGEKYKSEFKNSFGGKRHSGGRSSAASEFFSLFNQAATYAQFAKGGGVGSSNVDKVKKLLKNKKIKSGDVSPNFVNSFAHENGITNLTSSEVIEISDTYAKGGGVGDKKIVAFYADNDESADLFDEVDFGYKFERKGNKFYFHVPESMSGDELLDVLENQIKYYTDIVGDWDAKPKFVKGGVVDDLGVKETKSRERRGVVLVKATSWRSQRRMDEYKMVDRKNKLAIYEVPKKDLKKVLSIAGVSQIERKNVSVRYSLAKGGGVGDGFEIFKQGIKVRVDEAYLNDEASGGNATATATVIGEPRDNDDDVQIQYENGTIDYLDQQWLEPIGDSMAKGGGVGSFFDKLKSKTKTVYEKAKEGTEKAYGKSKKYVKDKVHDQKKKIALEVIDETIPKVAVNKKAKEAMKYASDLVYNTYEKGGGMKGKYKIGGEVNAMYETAYDTDSISKQALERVETFLNTNNVPYDYDSDEGIISFEKSGLNEMQMVYLNKMLGQKVMAKGGVVTGVTKNILKEYIFEYHYPKYKKQHAATQKYKVDVSKVIPIGGTSEDGFNLTTLNGNKTNAVITLVMALQAIRKGEVEFEQSKDYFVKVKAIKNNEMAKDGGVGYKIGDVVYNKEHNTIGIVRDVFDRNDLRTDADGVVDMDKLEIYDKSNSKHKSARIAPSTKKELGSKYEDGGDVEVSDEELIREILNHNGEITHDGLKDILGYAPHYPICKVGELTLRKKYMLGYREV